jgi:hypothetical protein
MALYVTTGIMNSRATIANYGERKRRWSGSKTEATKDRQIFVDLGFDVVIEKVGCPQDKKTLIELLNRFATK